MKTKMAWLALALVLTLAVGLAPAPALSAPICLVGCVDDDYCRRDSDCTARPGGRCNLICPRNGCCAYS
ncbi:MAG TPA: hypothetical protein VF756_23495 [Thermoanaerobaculia bacterium]